ncbi:TrmB family transcriptional regulator [Candidatus Woesearchaeota archaeon]|jgi:sugar-specific transcriptional regulator TrmB|nr:TrmB family transcriptional regulator [Candidatus Woesearchaeota archaeon]MBT5272981.1 TrmB family transcriptional regulator [Candidatus Woesearchaeota archaeon]MBT6041447.1 TrmB family transcriptional regulator [Candidatus Woesearchaeota archaeon]MBT6336472.1 TrmB family transcriptional regulator [Candidatus Woesearchaeota archaeon]MBT7927362.1 TrmB family transcriptional regulator [Candidatus Woesearchaeota archaeon]
MTQIEQVLDRLGFSEYKKKAYLTLLKLKKATPCKIAKVSGIPSSKIYEVLSWLYEKGYIVQVSEKPAVYEANNPKYTLGSEIKSRMSDLEELKQEVNKIESNIEITEKGTFSVIKGYDGFFKKMKEVTQRSTKSSIGIVQNWKTDKEILDLEKDAIKRGVKIRYLGPIQESTKEFVNIRKKFGVEIRDYNSPHTRFGVWDDKIVMISLRKDTKEEFMSLWIENEVLSKIFVESFENLWKK